MHTISKPLVSCPVRVRPWAARGVLVALVAALTACGTKEAPGPLEPTGPAGRIRFVNLINDPTRNPVNAILEKVPFGVNLGYTASTPSSLGAPNTANYSAILTGDRSLVLKKTADTTMTVANFTVTINAGEDRTVYATGGGGGGTVSSFVTTDANPVLTATQTRVRVVNLSPAAGSIDVFITPPNADLSTAIAAVLQLDNHSASNYLTILAPGTYQFQAVPAGTAPANRSSSVIVNIPSITLGAASGRTIVVADKAAGGTPVTAFVLTDQ
jgi:hypothetical protein